MPISLSLKGPYFKDLGPLSGLRILIWAPQVPFSVTPKKNKMGHFGSKNFTANGRKGRTSKTKTVLKSVNKTEQLEGMSKSKREKKSE